MASLFDLSAVLKLDSSQYEKGIKTAKNSAQGFSGKLDVVKKTAGKVTKALAAVQGAAATAFLGSAVKTTMEVDTAMSQVAATMGKTTDEVTDLRDFAKQMGANTAFSAKQAADALNYMALAGYDADTSMKMLPTVLDLAAAGSMDLASASDMVTDSQSALGLSLDETSEMVDKMAKASSKSNTSVAQLGEAFLTIGGTAKNLSGGTTELSTALGLLADNGIKASEGGTSLRNILLNLTPKSEDAAKAMESIGLNAYDAEGNMRPLKDIFADMNEGMADMTTEQKTNVLSNIFNKVDLKAVNALLATNVDRWDDLSSSIDDSRGAAQAMAETQLDNLGGDVTILKSAFEGLQISIGEKVSPALRDLVEYATDAISGITEWISEGGIEDFLEDAQGKLEDVGDYLSDTFQPTLDVLKDAFDTISEAVQPLIDKFTNYVTSEQSSEDATKALKSAIDALATIINTTVTTISDLIGWFTSGSPTADLFTAAISGVTAAIVGFKLATIASTVAGNAELLVLGLQVAALDAVAVAQGALNAVMNANPIGVIILLITGLVAAIMVLWKKNEGFRAAVKSIWEFIKNVFENSWTGIKAIWDFAVLFFQLIWEGIQDVFNGVVDWFKGIFQDAYDAVTGVFDGITDFFSDLWDDITELFGDVGTAIGDTVGSAFKDVINGILGFAEDTINGFIKAINKAIKVINKIPKVSISELDLLDIPKLAKGAVIEPNNPFTAVLGDQTSGVNIETPLDTMVDAFNTSLDSRPTHNDETVALLKGIYGYLENMNLESDIRDAVQGLEFKANDREMARVVRKYANT